MDDRASTSTVAVEYHDPYNLYPLLSPGLLPRLPLRHLHWPSHAGPLRSIDTLLVDLVPADAAGSAAATQPRHQLPGLRRTPYLKLLLVRCDDNEKYKSSVRSEIREWIKTNTQPATSGSKKSNNQEKHDACEWLIVHVVIPNTAAATQPRSSSVKSDVGTTDKSTSSRWRTGSTPLFEKLRSDFNTSGKGSLDRVAQIRIGINDLPYDLLPRVVPAVPTGYSETEADAEQAWNELIGRLKSLILQSFDMRVTQYEDDIKERDAQRSLPGWNFCTFFILKEGLAQGFESVGLVEDALVGYDELSVGLDLACAEQIESPTALALPQYTEELRKALEKAAAEAFGTIGDSEEAEDLQSQPADTQLQALAISATRKPYRSMIPENKVSLFDFRCYIFSRQIELLLRSANASSTRDELLSKLKEQQESILYGEAPMAPATPQADEGPEDLSKLAGVCQRTLEFIPTISQIMRNDLLAAWGASEALSSMTPSTEIIDNVVSSFAFSVAQQIIAQTSTKALPIPPSSLPPHASDEQKVSIPEPKTMMHPARNSSLSVSVSTPASQPPPSPGFFPGPGASTSDYDARTAHFAKAGLEELAAKRAELYMLSRAVLDRLGHSRGWSTGWPEAPLLGDSLIEKMEDVSLDETEDPPTVKEVAPSTEPLLAGLQNQLLQTAVDTSGDFYRLYEILTDKALRHHSVAGHEHSVQANMIDLAVLKYHLKDYRNASRDFPETIPFFGKDGWSLLELSMLIMYAHCLRELKDDDAYIPVALKLLIKTCAAEQERLRDKKTLRLGSNAKQYPDAAGVIGVTEQLLTLAHDLQSERKAPLEHFVMDAELGETLQYDEGQDSCQLDVRLWSLLPEELKVDAVWLRASSAGNTAVKEVKFKTNNITLKPGRNSLKLRCNTIIPGRYSADRLVFQAGRLTLEWAKQSSQQLPGDDSMFRRPQITMYQRAEALDLTMAAAKHTALDQNNSLNLELATGWNSLSKCEIHVKPATGGLRLLTTETTVLSPGVTFAKRPEAGVFAFGPIPPEQCVVVQFPYTVEQDVADVLAKVDIVYTTDSEEEYRFAKMASVPVALALGVNVQDVFKHQALFSRFNVTTASMSPLRLVKTELLASTLFEAHSGPQADDVMTVFPRQSASLLYRVSRKEGATLSGRKAARTMYLKLHYRSLLAEAEALTLASLRKDLQSSGLGQFAHPVCACVAAEFNKGLQPADLERAGLIGSITTSHLAETQWERHFQGFGQMPDSRDSVSSKLASFIRDWQKSHSHISVKEASAEEPSSILIPVEIPSIPIVHTADIRLLDTELHINQAVSAVLHLKWTRRWDTQPSQQSDLEYSYEVTASSDTWLLGGRRKGHFVIPSDASASSTPETEAEIPLILIPLREGWLSFPSVEIKEVAAVGSTTGAETPCEVDFKNIGETLRVRDEKGGVTVSLDASGPSGGPLVLDTQV
ncbi:trafficking protein particle complex subunit 10, TRAPPC10 domain-containing protein [Sarocladium implicatum]|nr:trafficking protein particle complex subunit 10, TRAPPC10 domain-containing protein [Sarocladium implicatum]